MLALARAALARPFAVLALLALGTAGAATGLFRLRLWTDGAALHPRGNPVVEQTQADYEFASSELARLKKLADRGSVTQEVADEKQKLLRAADSARKQTQARIASARAAVIEKRALIERLSKPSGLTEDEKVKLASTVIQRAVRNGLSEVQVYRFPNSLTTDHGRAINQQEPGWERSLQGIPAEIFQLWTDYLKPRGYRIKYQIVDFPGGVPGDISITLAWGD